MTVRLENHFELEASRTHVSVKLVKLDSVMLINLFTTELLLEHCRKSRVLSNVTQTTVKRADTSA